MKLQLILPPLCLGCLALQFIFAAILQALLIRIWGFCDDLGSVYAQSLAQK